MKDLMEKIEMCEAVSRGYIMMANSLAEAYGAESDGVKSYLSKALEATLKAEGIRKEIAEDATVELKLVA